MAESLAERAETLPTGPGVYLFKSKGGSVLYVGKAQNLRSRVRQYVGGGDGRIRIPALMQQAADVDVLLTPSVKDALLLENELIKRHRPRFNVRLRDDKQYLALRLDPKEKWPRLREVRKFARDGAEYFGPYTSSVSMKEAVSHLRRIFPLRSCTEGTFKDYARRGRPCIEYEMKRCLGPCCGLVDEPDYGELVRGTALFLRGRSDELIEQLQMDVPRFRYGENSGGGVGSGDGEVGQPIGRGKDEEGSGQAGSDPGAHILEVDVTLEELAQIMADELQLPRIEPKGNANISQEKYRYNSIRRSGPESLRHFKRTYVQALRRQIATGTYNLRRPRVVPFGEDKR